MGELVFPERIEVKELAATQGRITIQPLERGHGTTLGNALRRILLSSIPGAAVVRVNLASVYHEYDTIEGIKESVLEIILNLKGVSLRLHDDELKRLTIEKQGPCEVKAADIDLPLGVEIANPELHIATLNEQGKLEMELEVESGFGYRSAEMNRLEEASLAVIPIDSDFSPVRQVSFAIEETRVGGSTGYEQLNLDITTDGGIKPEEALSEAASILRRYLDLFSDFGEHPFGIAKGGAEDEIDTLSASLEELEIDRRSCNLLKEAEITTLSMLISRPREELLDIHGFGAKSLAKVEDRLRELGYALEDEVNARDEA